jgi:hypothetical protein
VKDKQRPFSASDQGSATKRLATFPRKLNPQLTPYIDGDRTNSAEEKKRQLNQERNVWRGGFWGFWFLFFG